MKERTDQEMRELLAWYVNGTLNAAQKRQVEAWLADNPEAQLELAELEFMQETVLEVSASEPVMRPDLFDELLSRIDADAPPVAEVGSASQARSADQAPSIKQAPSADQGPAAAHQPVRPTRHTRTSWWSGFRQWLEENLQWGMTPAFARVAVVSQFAVVAVLGSLLLWPAQEEGFEVLSGTPPGAQQEGVLADIGVSPDLPLGAFQHLLQQQRAVIVDGPNSIGIYRIRLPADDQAAARLEALQAKPEVVYLQRVGP